MAISREKMVRTIAKDLYLREDVVQEVLDRFVDVCVDELINNGELKIHRLIDVSTVEYKGYNAGKGVVPAHRRLKIRLSSGIHKLFKMKEADSGLNISKDNWTDFLTVNSEKKIVEKNNYSVEKADSGYNPFLDED